MTLRRSSTVSCLLLQHPGHLPRRACRCLRRGSVVATAIGAPTAEGSIGVTASGAAPSSPPQLAPLVQGSAGATAPSPVDGPAFRRCRRYKGIVGHRRCLKDH
uniref:Uncharacterized protein n=1 Tax=Oryza punctata TaxID=4537 RepID=A0A0E0LVB9_ORYPU